VAGGICQFVGDFQKMVEIFHERASLLGLVVGRGTYRIETAFGSKNWPSKANRGQLPVPC